MKVYTKTGDAGTTSLVHTKNISKSDDRVEALGSMDELTSNLGLVKTKLSDAGQIQVLEQVQETLMTIMAGVADSYNTKYKLKEDSVACLEQEIDRMEASFERPRHFILPGDNPISAQIDVARTVARRAERNLAAVAVKFGCDQGAKRYLNRLADYLYVLARYYDARSAGTSREEAEAAARKEYQMAGENTGTGEQYMSSEKKQQLSEEELIQQVLMRMGQGRMTLATSKRLIELIEAEAVRRGKKAVIAVCGPDGNPIAVHVMDGAFLVSFDVAMKKAYTSVAVKMSTMELAKLAQPGETFFGLDKMGDGKIVIFGGGVPLKCGDTIIGGLGISGGTGEEDHSLAEYGLSVLAEALGQK